METIVLGGGCFWCIEALFKQLKGVDKVISGYAGGHTRNPTYEQMHYASTGHAEVVQITFDPNAISYRDILEIFFTVHDPTTTNQQGNDIGEEYRSIILYNDDLQKSVAQDVIKNFAAKHWDNPIVSELKKLEFFYPAEDYHQNFFEKNPEQAYCQVVINPKLQKFRQKFSEKLKT